jgi:hypothetical protein
VTDDLAAISRRTSATIAALRDLLPTIRALSEDIGRHRGQLNAARAVALRAAESRLPLALRLLYECVRPEPAATQLLDVRHEEAPWPDGQHRDLLSRVEAAERTIAPSFDDATGPELWSELLRRHGISAERDVVAELVAHALALLAPEAGSLRADAQGRRVGVMTPGGALLCPLDAVDDARQRDIKLCGQWGTDVLAQRLKTLGLPAAELAERIELPALCSAWRGLDHHAQTLSRLILIGTESPDASDPRALNDTAASCALAVDLLTCQQILPTRARFAWWRPQLVAKPEAVPLQGDLGDSDQASTIMERVLREQLAPFVDSERPGDTIMVIDAGGPAPLRLALAAAALAVATRRAVVSLDVQLLQTFPDEESSIASLGAVFERTAGRHAAASVQRWLLAGGHYDLLRLVTEDGTETARLAARADALARGAESDLELAVLERARTLAIHAATLLDRPGDTDTAVDERRRGYVAMRLSYEGMILACVERETGTSSTVDALAQFCENPSAARDTLERHCPKATPCGPQIVVENADRLTGGTARRLAVCAHHRERCRLGTCPLTIKPNLPIAAVGALDSRLTDRRNRQSLLKPTHSAVHEDPHQLVQVDARDGWLARWLAGEQPWLESVATWLRGQGFGDAAARCWPGPPGAITASALLQRVWSGFVGEPLFLGEDPLEQTVARIISLGARNAA